VEIEGLLEKWWKYKFFGGFCWGVGLSTSHFKANKKKSFTAENGG
jgi:hypothetical protein